VGTVLGAALLVASVPASARTDLPAFAGTAGLPTIGYQVIGVSYPTPLGGGSGDAAAPPVSAPLVLPPAPGEPATEAAAGSVGALGIPDVAVAAYQAAADRLTRDQPGCRVPWTLIAGIGRVESGHARGGRVDAAGRTAPLILGPVLDGTLAGNAAIRDTDKGRYDQDTVWDRAVGPMQFLPGTWERWGADGNGDGVADPHNIRDAALGTGRYLCSGGGDLSQDGPARAAVFSYNHSSAYVDTVLAWSHAYATGAVTIPALPPAPATTTPGPSATTAGAATTTPGPSATTAGAATTTPGPSATTAGATTTPATTTPADAGTPAADAPSPTTDTTTTATATAPAATTSTATPPSAEPVPSSGPALSTGPISSPAAP
jgi:hypothetical protein